MTTSAPRRPILAMLVAALIPTALAAFVVFPLRAREAVSDLADADWLQPAGWQSLGADSVRWMTSSVRGAGWQPLAWLSLAIDRTLREGGAAGLHDTNCALHSLNAALAGALVFLLLRRTGAARTWPASAPLAAALAAAAWGVHPLRIESVAMLSARGELLSTAFGLATACAWISAVGGPSLRRGPFALAVLASTAAALSSPVAAALVPGWIALTLWLGRIGADSRAAGRVATPLATLCAPPALAFVASWAARAPDATLPLGERIAAAGQALVLPLWDTFVPSGLHPFRDPPPGAGGSGAPPEWWVRTAMAALIAGAAVRSARRRGGTGLATLATCAAAFVAWAIGREVAGSDRMSYAATLPLFVAAGVWIGDGAGCLLAFLGAPLAGGLVVVPALVSGSLVGAWKDDAALAARVLAADPANDRVHAWLADRARRGGNPAEAEAAASAATTAGGLRPWSETALALAAIDRGDEAAAMLGLTRATEAAPWIAEPWIHLSALHLRRGRLEPATAAARSAVRADADSARAWTALARALRTAGDREGAIRAWTRASLLDPADGRIREELGTLRGEPSPKHAAPR